MAELKDFALAPREGDKGNVVEGYVSVRKCYAFKSGKSESGVEWRKFIIETDQGNFVGFENSIVGKPNFIPKDGVEASIVLRKTSYKDKDGKEKDGYDLLNCTFNEIGLKAQLATAGMMKSGFSGSLSLGL